jgi:hypothetical protein
MDKHYVSNHKDHAIGREVHVEGWGSGPFFRIQAIWGDTVHLSRVHEDRTRYTVKACRCYFTKFSWKQVEAMEGAAK